MPQPSKGVSFSTVLMWPQLLSPKPQAHVVRMHRGGGGGSGQLSNSVPTEQEEEGGGGAVTLGRSARDPPPLVQAARHYLYLHRQGAHCTRAVREVGYLRPVSPHGQGNRSNNRVPVGRTAQILTQSPRIMIKPTFVSHEKCVHLLLLPCERSSPGGGVFRVVTGMLMYCWALCPRCARAVQNRPPRRRTLIHNFVLH